LPAVTTDEISASLPAVTTDEISASLPVNATPMLSHQFPARVMRDPAINPSGLQIISSMCIIVVMIAFACAMGIIKRRCKRNNTRSSSSDRPEEIEMASLHTSQ
jgi:hypothetical protein